MKLSKIKLAFCTYGIFPHMVGGTQRHSRLLIEELSKYDIEIVVFHPHEEKIFTEYSNVVEIYIPDIDKNKNYLTESYKYSKRIYNYLKDMPEHIIYSQGLSVWYGIKQLENTTIVNPHGLEPYQAISIKDKLIAVPFKKIFNYIFRNANYVISLGGGLSDILKRIIKEQKIIVLPNGVNLPKSYDPIVKNTDIIELLFVGRFASNKGIDLLLQAATELNNEGFSDKIIYNLAGQGPLWETLQRKYNLPNIIFHGLVSDDKLSNLYKTNHIFVLPTLFEGMPTVVHEAMTHHLPIIVSNVGATAEQVDEANGYLIERNNKQALKDAIIDFIKLSPENKKKMGEASLQKIKNNFLWKVIAKKHYNLFMKINLK